MQSRAFGRTGAQVSCFGFGAMALSVPGRPDERDSIRLLHMAFDLGFSWIDMAHSYAATPAEMGHNERLVSEALRSWPGDCAGILLCTKGGLVKTRRAFALDANPKRLREHCDASRKALGVETVGVYYLHAPPADRQVLEDCVGELARLVQDGSIKYIGLSNVTVEQLAAARRIAPIAAVQNAGSPLWPHDFGESGVVRYCEREGVAFVAYSPLGGKYNPYLRERLVHLLKGKPYDRIGRDDALCDVARRNGATPYEVSLAWLLTVSPVVLPIPGARTAEHLRSIVSAGDLDLSPADLRDIDIQAERRCPSFISPRQ